MWDLDDSDFNVVGEHYVSLSEFCCHTEVPRLQLRL